MYALVPLIFLLFFTGCDTKSDTSSTPVSLNQQQWYLNNTGQFAGSLSGGTRGEDIRLGDTWSRYRGRGVTVAVVDSGIEQSHEDLAENIDPALCATYYNGKVSNSDSTPVVEGPTYQLKYNTVYATHGTACAGIAAGVGDNTIGIKGVAPGARLAGLNVFADTTPGQFFSFADALYNPTRAIDVSSNSWTDGPGIITDDSAEYTAIQEGAAKGRDGKGSIYVFAGGNYRYQNENANWFRELNNPYVIAVASLNATGRYSSYSNRGANLLVSGFGGEFGDTQPAIVTTDLTGEFGFDALEPNPYTIQKHYKIDGNENAAYTNQMNGTSAATPMVAGVVALMLEANPSLTYRDVRYILAATARKNDPTNSDWIQNGAGHWVNHNYGFGAVDAVAAVKQAETFAALDGNITKTYDSGSLSLDVPDGGILEQNITAADTMLLEHVELYLLLEHNATGDLNITLTSPAGTSSILSGPSAYLPNRFFYDYSGNYGFTLGSVRYLDENSSGTWRLDIRDEKTPTGGTLHRFKLILHGRNL